MTDTRLALLDTGEANNRILSKQEYRADFRRVEGASLKRTTNLSSAEGKRLFHRCFYSFQASLYFISVMGRAKLDHDVVERIELDIRESIDAATKEINQAIDGAEHLLREHNIEQVATYDTVPLELEIGVTSALGRRYFDLMHKLDLVMPLLQTLAIEEVITEREHEMRRSRFKRIVLSQSTKARNFMVGTRRRMNQIDAKANETVNQAKVDGTAVLQEAGALASPGIDGVGTATVESPGEFGAPVDHAETV